MAKIAEDHWRRWLPKAYATITDRAAFFQELEDEAESQIENLADSLAEQQATSGETFMERAARLRWAQQMAESQVIREFLLLEPEPQEEPETSEGEDPDEEFQTAVAEFYAAMADLRDVAPPVPPE